MVVNGVTVVEPDNATEPIPASMETVVAPDVLQESVLLWPFPTVEGEAENDEMSGGQPVHAPLKATSTLTVSLEEDSVPVEA